MTGFRAALLRWEMMAAVAVEAFGVWWIAAALRRARKVSATVRKG